MIVFMKVKLRVREVRVSKDISQHRLSVLAEVDQAGLSRLESGRAIDPRVSTLMKLADALNVPLTALVQKVIS